MSDEYRTYGPSDEEITRIYGETRTIAVVGASEDPAKPAHRIPRYLQGQNYRIIPVNPKGGQILGERAYASLTDLEEAPEVVDVFRPSDETPDIARDAVKAGAKVLWLQEGIYSDEARDIAEEAGLTVVMGRCMGATHALLGLGPGPGAT